MDKMDKDNERAHFKRVHRSHQKEDGMYAMRAPVYHSAPMRIVKSAPRYNPHRDRMREELTLVSRMLKEFEFDK